MHIRICVRIHVNHFEVSDPRFSPSPISSIKGGVRLGSSRLETEGGTCRKIPSRLRDSFEEECNIDAFFVRKPGLALGGHGDRNELVYCRPISPVSNVVIFFSLPFVPVDSVFMLLHTP